MVLWVRQWTNRTLYTTLEIHTYKTESIYMPSQASNVNPLVLPMNPIRELRGAVVNPMTTNDLVNPANYKPGTPGQMAADFRRMGNKIYLNGKALNDIIKPLKIAAGADFLDKFASDEKAEQSSAQEKLVKLYEGLSGKAYTNRADLITHFKLHQNLYLNIAENSADNKLLINLLTGLRDTLDGFYDKMGDLTEFYRNILQTHLFAELANEEEKSALFNFMTTFAHQGGVFYAAYTRILEAFGRTGAFHGESLNTFNNMGPATVEFNYKDGILEIREISQIQKLGYGLNEEGEQIFNYESIDPNYNLIDMNLVHQVRYNPTFPQHFALTVHENANRAYIHDTAFWDITQLKLQETKMLLQMQPILQVYANSYLQNGHNAKEAQDILNKFPVIAEYESFKKVSPRFFNAKEVEHNKYDCIFTVLNKITNQPAREIEENFASYAKAGMKQFTLAMKLLYRLGHEHTLATLLQPYNKDNLVLDKLVKQSTIENLYPAILKAVIAKEQNNTGAPPQPASPRSLNR